MQRAAKDLQEVKEPWRKFSGAAVLWVFPKPGLGLGLNAVGFWGRAGTLCCCMCRQRRCSFRLAERQPA